MSQNRKRRPRSVAIILAAAVAMAFAAYAFTASNTVPASSAGDGSGTISGYTITNVAYQLEAANPANIDSVTFTTSAAAGTVRAKVVSGSTTYTSCSGGPTNWTCDFSTNPTVVSADQLRVIAVQ
ncbi:MAG TPA: hypothetical protein VFU99_03325 [Gaiellaceae bacterium]|nr:hypothetical protein [Gaiellaceae bacterium]